MLFFTYGAFMKNQPQHGLLKNASFVCKGFIRGKLYDLGVGFPAASEEEGEIYGELYEIDEGTLSDIDEIQGYKADLNTGLFFRKRVRVQSFSKEFFEAEAYYMREDELKRFFITPLEGGRWA